MASGEGGYLSSLKGLEIAGRGGERGHRLLAQARRAVMGKTCPGSALSHTDTFSSPGQTHTPPLYSALESSGIFPVLSLNIPATRCFPPSWPKSGFDPGGCVSRVPCATGTSRLLPTCRPHTCPQLLWGNSTQKCWCLSGCHFISNSSL